MPKVIWLESRSKAKHSRIDVLTKEKGLTDLGKPQNSAHQISNAQIFRHLQLTALSWNLAAVLKTIN